MNIESITLHNFVDLAHNEKDMVLNWRNDVNVRQWMYNTEVISQENHYKFIASLCNDLYNYYFLVKDDTECIGVVYFNNIDHVNESVSFGLYGSLESEVKGIGRILEEVCIDYAFNKLQLAVLKLEVFKDNIKVVNLHKKYEFYQTSIKKNDNKEVLCMELKNENR